MDKYFDINFEFDRDEFDIILLNAIKFNKKGCICIVDGNVLANTLKIKDYRTIINNSIVNACDGSSIAVLAGLIHKKKLRTYTGYEIFIKYIKQECRQLFLGNTENVLNKIKKRFLKEGISTSSMIFSVLPYLDVNDFNYKSIGDMVNSYKPDLIWVSLGAPKQEIFINNLLQYTDKGVLIGIGAVFNFYSGDEETKRAPGIFSILHLEWLFRVFQEPKRVGKRAYTYLTVLPKIIIDEIKQLQSN